MNNCHKLKNKNLLIAEDERVNFIYIEEILEETGANIHHALNGKLAVELADNNEIDIVLMDLKMPEMTGFEATKIIRKKYPNLPIIALTAFAFEDEIKNAIDARLQRLFN